MGLLICVCHFPSITQEDTEISSYLRCNCSSWKSKWSVVLAHHFLCSTCNSSACPDSVSKFICLQFICHVLMEGQIFQPVLAPQNQGETFLFYEKMHRRKCLFFQWINEAVPNKAKMTEQKDSRHLGIGPDHRFNQLLMCSMSALPNVLHNKFHWGEPDNLLLGLMWQTKAI